jgi:hypothetical protein
VGGKTKAGHPENKFWIPASFASTWNVILGKNEVPQHLALLRMTALTSKEL